MAELYTQPELSSLDLPGFQDEATLEQSLAEGTAWQTVLSLTIVTETPDGIKVLDGIRREDTNLTHPGIVSTPTGRLPQAFARHILQEKMQNPAMAEMPWRIDEVNPQRPLVITQLPSNSEPLPDRESGLPYVGGSLMAGKLGCAGALEHASADNPLGTISLATILGGFSYATDDKETGAQLFEPLIMLGAVINLKDPSIIDDLTESYRKTSWVGLADYQEGFVNKRADLLIPAITPEEEVSVCVRGLCLATSNASVADRNLLQAHISPPSGTAIAA